MSGRSRRWWGPCLGGLAIIALIVGYYRVTEPVHEIVPGTPPAKVRDNPYYAAQTLLRGWHRPSRRVFSTRALFPLPDTGVTLVVDGQRGRLGADRVAELIRWVRAGGRLIIAPRPPVGSGKQAGRDDPLLAALGVSTRRLPAPKQHDDAFNQLLDRFKPMDRLFLRYCTGDGSQDQAARCDALTCQRAEPVPPPAISRSLDSAPRALQPPDRLLLSWHPLPHARIAELGRAADPDGIKMLRLAVGRGRVTVITDLRLWDNNHLLYFDHAWLLKRLTGEGPVWFVHGIHMPPLPLWLWQHAWPPLLALALLLALWLWRRLPRRGPILADRAGDDTDYLGHLAALGEFHWRLDRGDDLLAPLRQRARRRLALLHPRAEQALAIAAERLAVPEAELHAALNETPPRRAAELWVRRVTLLQCLTRSRP